MDEFGVLVESIGFKAHGKSVPMSHLKSNPNPKSNTNYGFNTALPQDRAVSSSENPSKSRLSTDSFVDDLDGIFLSKTNISNDSNDIFGGSKPPLASHSQGSLDLESVFEFNRSSSNHTSNFYDDLFTSTPQNTDAIHDLLGNFGAKSQSFKSDSEVNGSQFDDLIPGFGGISTTSIGSSNSGIRNETKHSQLSSGQSFNSSSGFVDDPFLVFESSNSTNASSSVQCSIDDLEKFAMGKVNDDASDKQRSPTHIKIKLSLRNRDERVPNKASVPKIKKQNEVLHQKQKQKDNGRTESLIKEKDVFVNGNDLNDIFGMGTEPSHVSSSRTEDPFFDTLFNGGGRSKVKQASPKTPYSTERPSGTSFSDNFASLFGEAAASSEAFQEIEGESEERRRARLNHHMRTQARMAKALAEKNQRDLETQYEQEHRRKLATTLDGDIKRWAAGKEGNLRALLSSLQDVLWPECGWRPVSLTDLITSVSVKKVYQKATLCVHPDKVQQKGADLQQKYIAEKVFDLLKEAWNKFTAEELR